METATLVQLLRAGTDKQNNNAISDVLLRVRGAKARLTDKVRKC